MSLRFDISSITPSTGGGGPSVNVSALDITPTTSAQSFVANVGEAYNPVNVSAVNASIDANITAGNIRKDVNILGVTGTMAPAALHSASKNYSVVGTEAVPFNGDLTGAFDGLTSVAANAMKNAFDSCTVNTPVIFPDLTQIGDNGMNRAFYSCKNIPSISFPNLTSVSGNYAMIDTFGYCNKVNSVTFDKLVNISGNYALYSCFSRCNNMTSASFPNLVSATGESCFYTAFSYTNITELNFPKLVNVGISSFGAAGRFINNLTNINFCNVVSVGDGAFAGIVNNSSNFAGYANFSSLSTVTNNGVFQGAFRLSGVTSVDFSNLMTISGANAFCEAFAACKNIAYVNFDNLQSVSGGGSGAFWRTFEGAGITTASFPNLANVLNMAWCFWSCQNLTNIYMPNLYNIGYQGMNNCFRECTNLTNAAFNSLYNVYYNGLSYAFYGCTNLTELRFPALGQAWSNSFDGMLQGCTGVTVHFPAAMQSTMSGWSSVTGGFGGTSTTVLWDL